MPEELDDVEPVLALLFVNASLEKEME